MLYKILYNFLFTKKQTQYTMKHSAKWYNDKLIASGDTKASKVTINILGFEIERKFDPIKSNKFFEQAFKHHFKKNK